MYVTKRGIFLTVSNFRFFKVHLFFLFYSLYTSMIKLTNIIQKGLANNQISTLAIKYNSAMATMNASTIPMITL